jgi:hypothetical protein
MTFRFELGALVVAKSSLESAVQELALPESYERWDGSFGRYAEGSLMTVVDAYDTWRRAVEANKKVPS